MGATNKIKGKCEGGAAAKAKMSKILDECKEKKETEYWAPTEEQPEEQPAEEQKEECDDCKAKDLRMDTLAKEIAYLKKKIEDKGKKGKEGGRMASREGGRMSGTATTAAPKEEEAPSMLFAQMFPNVIRIPSAVVLVGVLMGSTAFITAFALRR